MTQTVSPTLAVLPLIYNYADTIVGRGFVAKVNVQGLLLAQEEVVTEGGTEFWLEGVQPGGLSDHGQTLGEAHANFRQGFTAVLFDISEDAKDFADFKRLVEDFVAEVSRPALKDWQDALQKVREEGLTGERWNIETRHVTEIPQAIVTVEELKVQTLQPIANELDQAPLIAA